MSAALELAGLRTTLDTPRGELRGVDGVDLAIARKEYFALVANPAAASR